MPYSLQSVCQKLQSISTQAGSNATAACPADKPPPSKAQAITNAANTLAIHNGFGFIFSHAPYSMAAAWLLRPCTFLIVADSLWCNTAYLADMPRIYKSSTFHPLFSYHNFHF